MRVHCISTGEVRSKRGSSGVRRYLPGAWSDRTLPVNVFAVEHPDGVCLFDTGQTARAARSGYFPAWHPFFRLARFELGPADEAAVQLGRRGIDLSAVRWVVLSHLHTDHVGGLGPFTEAEVLVSRVEWERAVGVAGRIRGYLPQYWPEHVEPRLVDFDGGPAGAFDRSHDVAGDGRLRLVPLPGHTPGHLGLLADAGGHTYLFGGDAAHSPGELETAAPTVADFCRRERVVYLATHDREALRRLTAA